MIYIPANENLCATFIGREIEYVPGRSYTGATVTMYQYPGSKHIGEVQAWNVDTGKRVWTHTFAKSANWGPVLTTGGGLVFSRRHQRSHVPRLRREERKSACGSIPTNSGIIGIPMIVLDRGQAIRRRSVGIRHRRAGDAGASESFASG